MADENCVVGPEIKVIERRGDYWVLDNGIRIDDISKCKILPSPHERRIILHSETVAPKKPVAAKKEPVPTPLVSVPEIVVPTPIIFEQQLPVSVQEEIQVLADTLIDKIQDLMGENIVSAAMLLGYALFKNSLDKKKGRKSEEEGDQKCKGRHMESSQQFDEMSNRLDEMKEELSKYAEDFKFERNTYATKRVVSDMNDKISMLEEQIEILSRRK